MKIAYVSSEAEPYVKTGGLADVVGALSDVMAEWGNEICLFLPLYKSVMDKWFGSMIFLGEYHIELSNAGKKYGLYKIEEGNKKTYFIDSSQYFQRENEYGYFDDGERFAFFSKCVLDTIVLQGINPDVIHCNDWQTSLVCVLKKHCYSNCLENTKVIFTIHNMEYQGVCGKNFAEEILMLDISGNNDLCLGGNTNMMKGGIVTADAVTTVSETYRQEIKKRDNSYDLCDTVCKHHKKIMGIVNGIDVEKYDPMTDRNLPFNYNSDNHIVGKSINKRILQKELGLEIGSDIVMIGMVSRLASHKGIDILCSEIENIAKTGAQIVILGKGDGVYEEKLLYFAKKYPDRLSFNPRFDNSLASKIYASSDIYLMPSEKEPCGLSQLIAMRYGSIPIVRNVGGLNDTVKEYEKGGSGNGFTIKEHSGEALLSALSRVISIYKNDRKTWDLVIKNAMEYDSSWEASAKKYHNLYNEVLARRA